MQNQFFAGTVEAQNYVGACGGNSFQAGLAVNLSECRCMCIELCTGGLAYKTTVQRLSEGKPPESLTSVLKSYYMLQDSIKIT